MIMPGSVPAAAARVQPELLNYLPKEWAPIISGDVDGDTSTPFRIDQATPSLGQVSATRRVARAVFMASAPLEGSQNQGVDTKRVILGVCQPNERPILFEDALRRLSNQAKFLHSNMGGAWYSRSPSINRLASDRASIQEEALVVLEIDKLLGGYIRSLRDKGPFGSIQVTPGGSADVPDEAEGVRLVVLGQAHPHNGKANSAAITEAKDVFLTRGKSPRVYRNTLVFLARTCRRGRGERGDAQEARLGEHPRGTRTGWTCCRATSRSRPGTWRRRSGRWTRACARPGAT